jgi:phenylalanyl-tRNA synthetase alpha chain
MEGVTRFSQIDFGDAAALLDGKQQLLLAEVDLKSGLEGIAKALFGNVQMKCVDAYFPFTEPSFELEIYFVDEWLEVFGCGAIFNRNRKLLSIRDEARNLVGPLDLASRGW